MSSTYYYSNLSSGVYQSLTSDDYQQLLISYTTIGTSGYIVNGNPRLFSNSVPASGDNTINSTDNLGGSNSNTIYKYLGASLLSLNLTIGYNGTPSSMNINLVEDTENGDSFSNPIMPTLTSVMLPSGGVGAPILYPSGYFPASDAPFYFAGLITNWNVIQEDINGRTISVQIVDPRDILAGVQCITGSFALSQNIGDGNPRFTGVNNFIDCFGYYNYGLESYRNAYGMPWLLIMNAIANSRVTINGINFEFWFNGEAFLDVPDWYRIEDNLIDLIGLCQKVCQDGGSDLILRAVKVDGNTAVVEIRGIKRSNTDSLTQTDVQTFINNRSSIVEHARVGTEYRNEATSNVVVGGLRNTNYVAWPTEYDQDIHLTGGKEDYSKFPSDIKSRLTSSTGVDIFNVPSDGSNITLTTNDYSRRTGAIFPFWGYASLSGQDPMIEPFLSLEHLVFDRNTDTYANVRDSIPYCRIDLKFFPVRQVSHNDVFLENDGTSDLRPFGYISDVKLNYSGPKLDGYMRGVPLNTEVLRAALVSEDLFCAVYNMYYPVVASGLRMRTIDWNALKWTMDAENVAGTPQKIQNLNPLHFMKADYPSSNSIAIASNANRDARSKFLKNTLTTDITTYVQSSLDIFNKIIYEQIRKYADEYCGRKFVVCLPRSIIMERMWNNLPVPTNVNKPEIEYNINQTGYWEYVPSIFDGIGNCGATSGTFTSQQEQQIVRRFSDIDGRFTAMAAIDWHPKGNICFNSNGLTKAMFQDLPESDFRPNQIAAGNADYIFTAVGTEQLVKRPDIALIDLPGVVTFDNLDIMGLIMGYTPPAGDGTIGNDQQSVIKRLGIIKYLQAEIMRNNGLRQAITTSATLQGISFDTCRSFLINSWAQTMYRLSDGFYKWNFDYERVMDLKSVVIPLSSNWVRYGPWYSTYDNAPGMVKIDVDDSLVPWNFIRPPSDFNWDYNLNIAGNEKVVRSLAVIDYLDSAVITCAGFPEMGIGQPCGFNSNITTISIDFGVGGIKTTYNMNTYAARPGTYRKGDYDNVEKGRVETRPRIQDVFNNNIYTQIFPSAAAIPNRAPD